MSMLFLRSVITSLLALTLVACNRTDSSNSTAKTDFSSKNSHFVAKKSTYGSTLKEVKARGELRCGVNTKLPGFAVQDEKGRWSGFDVDFCQATAAAIFGDPNRVTFVPLSTPSRFQALSDGRVDVLWRNTSWTFERDAIEGFSFPGINYYDGQGFLVPTVLNLHSALELNGARICVERASTTQLNLGDYFRSHNLNGDFVVVDTQNDAKRVYAQEGCDALSADISSLAATRATLPNPAAHIILPEVISKEPLGPVVREGDSQWNDVVRWTLFVTILAEEKGLTRDNIESKRRPPMILKCAA